MNTKRVNELKFQKIWVQDFIGNKDKVLEYISSGSGYTKVYDMIKEIYGV